MQPGFAFWRGRAIPELSSSGVLPLTPVAHGLHRGKVLAYDILPPADAEVFAAYEDGKPAAFSRKVGKGRVIYFAAHPFGNSELAVASSEWENFFRALANGCHEPINLPIWQFYHEKQS